MVKKIILCMIVKNESKIIERCITSCLPIIDAYSICDTGSTDNTVQVIEEVSKQKNLKGFVYNDTWKNFGYNRSNSFIFCLETAKKLNYDLKDTYALLLDADMCIKMDKSFNKKKLNEAGYKVIQKNNNLTYYNIRLIQLSCPWKCLGVTHEYWEANDSCKVIKYDSLYTVDINDGGCKDDKFERDISLLTQGIKDEPENARYYFYLAQSYMDSDKMKECIEWYKKRIEKGGWSEEVYYSMLKIGLAYKNLMKPEKAIFWFLKAHNFRPSRAEAIYEALNIYRLTHEYNTAYMLGKTAKSIPYPKDDILFISHNVYDYLIDFEMSIVCFYVGHSKAKEGYEYCTSLLKNPSVPQNIKDMTLKNINFYKNSLSEENDCIEKFEEAKVKIKIKKNIKI